MASKKGVGSTRNGRDAKPLKQATSSSVSAALSSTAAPTSAWAVITPCMHWSTAPSISP